MNSLSKTPWLRAAALAVALGACSSAGSVTVTDVWSRPVPPVSPASAVFLEITNDLETAVTLTGASSESCGSMEIHETTMDEAGVMAMRPLVDGLTVEPGTSSLLAPRGIHLMCLEPEVFEGSFDIELNLEGADAISVTATIEDR